MSRFCLVSDKKKFWRNQKKKTGGSGHLKSFVTAFLLLFFRMWTSCCSRLGKGRFFLFIMFSFEGQKLSEKCLKTGIGRSKKKWTGLGLTFLGQKSPDYWSMAWRICNWCVGGTGRRVRKFLRFFESLKLWVMKIINRNINHEEHQDVLMERTLVY